MHARLGASGTERNFEQCGPVGPHPLPQPVPVDRGKALAVPLSRRALIGAALVPGLWPPGTADRRLSVVDAIGRIVKLDRPARRIVALNAFSVAQLAGLGITPVGTNLAEPYFSAARYLFPSGRPIQAVTGADGVPDTERIIALEPDLVIAWSADEADLLQAFAPVMVVGNLNSVEAIEDNLRQLGLLTGRQDKAEAEIAAFGSRLATDEARSPRNRTLLILGHFGGANLFAPSQTNALIEMLDKIVIASQPQRQARSGWVETSLEAIYAQDADIILLFRWNLDGDTSLPKAVSDQPLWPTLRAVRTSPHRRPERIRGIHVPEHPDGLAPPSSPGSTSLIVRIAKRRRRRQPASPGRNGCRTMTLEPTAPAEVGRQRISPLLVGSLIGALVVILVLSLALGVAPIHWMGGSDLLSVAGDRGERIILLEMRLPRFCIAAISGAGLGAAGYLVQSALRNDLADPGLFGISAGAALAMAVVVVWQVDIGPGGLPLVTVAGGLGAGMMVLLAMRLTRNPAEMILFGVALGALFSAAILVLLLLANYGQVRTIYFFLVGSLIGKGMPDLWLELPWLSTALIGALLLIRPLDVLRLGDDMADGLGVGAFRTRILAILAAIGLVAPVVATCGPIGFISLLAPHAGRALLGRSDAAAVLPLCMLIGAVLLSGADLLARVAVGPGEWPVGLPVTLIGAPFVIFLLRRRSA